MKRHNNKVDNMKEEFLLEQKYGRRNPYKVPEGYFKQFEESFMDNLRTHERQQQKRKNKRAKVVRLFLRPVACAVCIALIVLSGFLFFHENVTDGQCEADNISKSYSASVHVSDYTIDDISDYAMLDNDDIYSYVSGE